MTRAAAERRNSGGAPRPCFHCGLPVAAGEAFGFHGAEGWRSFCCAGCEAVSRVIGGQGLDEYYRLREAVAARPGPGARADEIALYDEACVQERFVRAAGEGNSEADLIVEGMRCAACAWLVEQVLARVPGVVSAEVNYATRRARVRWRTGATRPSAVFAAVAAVGYDAWPYEEGRLALVADRERRALLRRLLVAGLGMMQVMMYAVPAYIAAEGEIAADIESLMRWAGLVLTTPVIAYSAAPFFAGAWRDLKLARLGVDVPVALGLAAAFAASAVATWSAQGAVYFDSVAMFVFLLTGGRYLEHIARERAGAALQRLAGLAPQSARRLRGDGPGTERIAAATLRPGDRVLVRPGEAVPADGLLESAAATLSEALLSGESRLIARREGARVLGGSLNAGGAFELRVTHVGEATVLSSIRRLMERALSERPRWVEAARHASAWFVGGILLCAAAAGLAWLVVDPARAPWVAISVLIVTCPCALSLATPVAMTAATGAMARRNVVVTTGHAIEALAGATDIVFDKTGTLTCGRPKLLEVLPLASLEPDACVAIAAAMGRGSSHPLDRAFVEARDGRIAPKVESHRSHAGAGAQALVDGRQVRIGRAEFAGELHGKPTPLAWLHSADTIVWLADASGWIAAFRIGDALRDESRAAVEALRALGLEVHLLTGDEPAAAERVAAELGIARVEARAAPSRKLNYVRALQLAGAKVAMVGDGINDAPVLGQADVSIAMGGGADLAQVRADAVLVSDSPADLVAALRLARRTRAVIRENLAWALGYNLVVLPLAFAGLVTPLIAGIGMAASSLAVVGNALRLRR